MGRPTDVSYNSLPDPNWDEGWPNFDGSAKLKFNQVSANLKSGAWVRPVQSHCAGDNCSYPTNFTNTQ